MFAASERDSLSKKKFGTLKTSIFYYITPWMVGLIALLTGLIAMNYSAVAHNFNAGHVALNGTIVAVFFAGVLQATYNNFQLYKVGQFLKKIEDVSGPDPVPQSEINVLLKMLEGPAALMNTITLYKLIDNLKMYGNILVTDNDARLIKSKFGYRVRAGRGSVSFLTGILVMFGLIGTFWGLLETIGAVASALDDIAKSSSSETSAADMDMGGIIGAISGPLQGMGLAFSASLFGLGSSLILGFYTHIAASAQNNVIEDISRWIDDRIPGPNASHVEKGQKLKAPQGKEEELKAWLASFAYLSHRTERRLGNLYASLTGLGSGFTDIAKSIQNVSSSQRDMNDLLQKGNADRERIKSASENIAANAKVLPQAIGDLAASVGDVKASVNGAARQLGDVFADGLSRVGSGQGQQDFQGLSNILSQLHSTQTSFVQKIDRLEQVVEKGQKDQNVDIEAVVAKMQSLVEDLRQNSVMPFDGPLDEKFFEDEDEQEFPSSWNDDDKKTRE